MNVEIFNFIELVEGERLLEENKGVPIKDFSRKLFKTIYGWAERLDKEIVNIHFVPTGRNGCEILIVCKEQKTALTAKK